MDRQMMNAWLQGQAQKAQMTEIDMLSKRFPKVQIDEYVLKGSYSKKTKNTQRSEDEKTRLRSHVSKLLKMAFQAERDAQTHGADSAHPDSASGYTRDQHRQRVWSSLNALGVRRENILTSGGATFKDLIAGKPAKIHVTMTSAVRAGRGSNPEEGVRKKADKTSKSLSLLRRNFKPKINSNSLQTPQQSVTEKKPSKGDGQSTFGWN